MQMTAKEASAAIAWAMSAAQPVLIMLGSASLRFRIAICKKIFPHHIATGSSAVFLLGRLVRNFSSFFSVTTNRWVEPSQRAIF